MNGWKSLAVFQQGETRRVTLWLYWDWLADGQNNRGTKLSLTDFADSQRDIIPWLADRDRLTDLFMPWRPVIDGRQFKRETGIWLADSWSNVRERRRTSEEVTKNSLPFLLLVLSEFLQGFVGGWVGVLTNHPSLPPSSPLSLSLSLPFFILPVTCFCKALTPACSIPLKRERN